MLATRGLTAFLASSSDDSPPPELPLCTPGERGSLAASVPLKRASDRLLFLSLRSVVCAMAGESDYDLDIHRGLLRALWLSVAARAEQCALRAARLIGA